MQSHVYENYLETEVLTATPQKLQLLLIDGTLRAIERGRRKWHEDDNKAASELLLHAQDIVGELLGGLSHDQGSEIVKRLSAVYIFVLRRLAEATLARDEKGLDEAVRVLEVERETWRQVCERYGSRSSGAASFSAVPHASSAVPAPIGLPIEAADAPLGGFSIEA